MKIRSVRHNNRKKVFEVGTSTKTLVFPLKAAPTPTTEDPVRSCPSIQRLAGRRLPMSSTPAEPARCTSSRCSRYNQDPTYLRDLLSVPDRRSKHRSESLRACSRSARSCARLGRSAAQLYRLLDQTNYRSLSISCSPCCKCST